MSKISTQSTLTPQTFTSQQKVKDCLEDLRQHFNGVPPQVSDVLDAQGNQYVNLVQKGGGVLGVALVGYTYVLEQMGIRFMRLAGTSAGAINTALMTVVGRKEEAKSERIIDVICNLNFFSLVDGHPAARWLIKQVITHNDYTTRLKKQLTAFVVSLLLMFVLDFVLISLEKPLYQYPWLSTVTQICFVLTGFALLIVGTLIFYLQRLMGRLKNSGFGINPGDFFWDWIKQQFHDNGVDNVTQLNGKAGQPIPGVQLRPGINHDKGIDGLFGDVTFITSELVTENKIQFPKMCNLFREADKIDHDLHPAGFVRSSMAIPLFFESFFINNIPAQSPAIKQAWMDTFGEENPPISARFVDGGLLSNFPISIFFNPDVDTPRLPTFGINLDDAAPEDRSKDMTVWSLGGYMGRMLSTLRGFYDKDFLDQNKAYRKGIGTIPLAGYNWLNFFLKDEDKIAMFIKGAEAARDFLKDFDWQAYKGEQTVMRKAIKPADC